MRTPLPAPRQLHHLTMPQEKSRADAAALRQQIAGLERRLARVRAVVAIPMWEHLALFILAFGFICYAVTVSGQYAPLAQGLALVLGVASILRPLVTIRYRMNRSDLIINTKRAIVDAEDELRRLEKDPEAG